MTGSLEGERKHTCSTKTNHFSHSEDLQITLQSELVLLV